MKTLIRCRILRRLIWVCTVCLRPKKRMPGLYELIRNSKLGGLLYKNLDQVNSLSPLINSQQNHSFGNFCEHCFLIFLYSICNALRHVCNYPEAFTLSFYCFLNIKKKLEKYPWNMDTPARCQLWEEMSTRDVSCSLYTFLLEPEKWLFKMQKKLPKLILGLYPKLMHIFRP